MIPPPGAAPGPAAEREALCEGYVRGGGGRGDLVAARGRRPRRHPVSHRGMAPDVVPGLPDASAGPACGAGRWRHGPRRPPGLPVGAHRAHPASLPPLRRVRRAGGRGLRGAGTGSGAGRPHPSLDRRGAKARGGARAPRAVRVGALRGLGGIRTARGGSGGVAPHPPDPRPGSHPRIRAALDRRLPRAGPHRLASRGEAGGDGGAGGRRGGGPGSGAALPPPGQNLESLHPLSPLALLPARGGRAGTGGVLDRAPRGTGGLDPDRPRARTSSRILADCERPRGPRPERRGPDHRRSDRGCVPPWMPHLQLREQ